MAGKIQKSFYIKKRSNPQLGTYYVAYGRMSKTAAKECERPLYGSNKMLKYDDETSYRLAIEQLEREGHKVSNAIGAA